MVFHEAIILYQSFMKITMVVPQNPFSFLFLHNGEAKSGILHFPVYTYSFSITSVM